MGLAPGTQGLLANAAEPKADVVLDGVPAWDGLARLCDQFGLAFHGLDGEGRIVLARPGCGGAPRGRRWPATARSP
jgi:hypothetical protein